MRSFAVFGRLRSAVPLNIIRFTSMISKRRFETYCIDPSIGLNDDQKHWQAVARNFAKNELFPYMTEWDKREDLPPREMLKKAGKLGFGAICCKKDFGGIDLPRLDASIIYEQLAAGCASSAAYMSIHNMCASIIDRFGSDKLRQHYIPKLAAFDAVASFFLTESAAGDDPAAIETIARVDGDHYVLNGSKLFILGSNESELYIVVARHENKTGTDGIFCVAVDSDTQGIEISKKTVKKYAWKDVITPHTITFRDCRVPTDNQIGGDVDGLTMSHWGLNDTRVNVASCWLGAAQMSIDLAIQHFKNEAERGKSSTDVLSDEWELADMACKLYAARLLVREAASHIQNKTPHVTSFCAMAKLHAETVGMKIMNDMLEMYQHFGIIKASPMTEYLHDCRSHDFIVGSDSEMRAIVAQNLLSKKTFF